MQISRWNLFLQRNNRQLTGIRKIISRFAVQRIFLHAINRQFLLPGIGISVLCHIITPMKVFTEMRRLFRIRQQILFGSLLTTDIDQCINHRAIGGVFLRKDLAFFTKAL